MLDFVCISMHELNHFRIVCCYSMNADVVGVDTLISNYRTRDLTYYSH